MMKFNRVIAAFLAIITAAACMTAGYVGAAAENIDGDINGDRVVNSADALMALEISVGIREVNDEVKAIADVDLNGVVNSLDALLILQKSVGIFVPVMSFKLSTGDTAVLVGSKLAVSVNSVTPKIADECQPIWTSSNTAVATVDKDGNVIAAGVGKAVITASMPNSTAKQSFTLTVGGKASSVALNTKSIKLRQGGSYKLKATVAPETTYNKSVKWTSSNNNVATVDANGNVRGKMIGSATITCTTADGTNKTAKCDVKVEAMSIPYVSQLPDYPTGCEAASCCMLLKYYGFSITMKQMVDTIPRKNLYKKNGKTYGPDINEMFVGDPRGYYTSANPGYGAFSPVVTKSLQKAIDARGGGYKAVKISGCTFAQLKEKVSQGHPAIVWATYKMQNPTKKNSWYIESTGKYFEYPRGTHVMILSGFSANSVVTVDPYDNGVLTFDMSLFESRWNLLGKQAIILEKVK